MAFSPSTADPEDEMPFAMTLTVESGDRYVLEDVVTEIKEAAEQKGVQLKGPHPQAPQELRVPQSADLSADGNRLDPWHYTVFTRTIEIIGHDEFARDVTEWDFPERVHIGVSVEQRRGAGR
ncbi:ribosomal protein S10 [Halorhabdus utahensis DSM 12940]|uniref:Small ribosomal subunit protein uS10 n=2 Tax=Halorhabdus utahensis TaxID=146826 RepID=C7NUG5_HALUD|nr:ribosomal protein S10 [Halorhabdus utahensis DSM 12940]